MAQSKKLTESDIQKLAAEFKIPVKAIKTIDAIESGGKGYDDKTGKIIIQFEPIWFKRQSPYTPSGKWTLNKVEVQVKEWEAFNDAFSKNADAAMESTSIGRMQILGLHYKDLGFKSVGAMWDYAKESEYNQMRLGMLFINRKPKMMLALKDLSKMSNCRIVASGYNGKNYEMYDYHNRIFNHYNKS